MSQTPTHIFSGPVPGQTPRARAVAAAGMLAESGITRLTLRAQGVERALDARVTDLPGEMERAGAGEILAETLGVALVFDERSARWRPLRGEQV